MARNLLYDRTKRHREALARLRDVLLATDRELCSLAGEESDESRRLRLSKQAVKIGNFAEAVERMIPDDSPILPN